MSAVKGAAHAAGAGRYKPYPAYQDSGVEWLGEIPAHWEVKRLKRVVQFQGGGTPAKDNVEYWRGEIPWVSPKDMKVSLVVDTEDKITADAVRKSATKLIPPGAVLIVVRSGILAHSIPVALAGCQVTLNQDMKAMIPRSELFSEYLVYLIAGMQRGLLVEWRKEGATVESLELESVACTPTLLPTIPEQRAIAAFLGRETARIDALVAKKERLIALLQEQRTALISDCVTGKAEVGRMKDENGNSSFRLHPSSLPMKDSGVEWLGEIPAHWAVKQLRQSIETLMDFRGRTPTKLGMDWGGDIPAISAVNVRDGYLDLSRGVNYGSQELHDRWMAQGPTRRGDVLFTTEAPLGNVALVPDDNQYILSQRVVLLRPHSAQLMPEYLHRLLICSAFRQGIEVMATGSTAEGIKRRYLMAIPVCVPPLAEQRAVAAFLEGDRADRHPRRQGPRGHRAPQGTPHRAHLRGGDGQDRRAGRGAH